MSYWKCAGWAGVGWGGVGWGGVVGWSGGVGGVGWSGVGLGGEGGVGWGGVQTSKHTKSPHKHMAPATETDDPSPRVWHPCVRKIQEHISKALVHTESARGANLQATKMLTGDSD